MANGKQTAVLLARLYDGMTIDAEGDVYLTGRGVTVSIETGKRSNTSTCRKAGPPMSASAGAT